MHLCRKRYAVLFAVILITLPFVASATDIFTTKEYVDETTVSVYQGEVVDGNTKTHEDDILQVNSSGNLHLVTPSDTPTSGSMVPITSGGVYSALSGKENKSDKLDASTGKTIADYNNNTTKYPSAKAVAQYAIQKPASASEGKVLTYGSGANADSRPVAQYIKVPVANGDPNNGGTLDSTTPFASIWLQ